MGIRGRRITAVTAALVAALTLLAVAASPAAAAEQGEKFKVGDRAPDFSLPDLAGNAVRLSVFAGKKTVLLAFFALRCGACLAESQHLERLHTTSADKGLAVLAVDTDGVDAATVSATMKDVGFATTYPVLVDVDFAVSDVYTNFIVPFTLLIDREGVIRYLHTGYEPGDERALEEAVRRATGP